MNNIIETNAIKTPEGLLFKTNEHFLKWGFLQKKTDIMILT